MLPRISSAVVGLDGVPLKLSGYSKSGTSLVYNVGLPDKQLKKPKKECAAQSKYRLEFPQKRITVTWLGGFTQRRASYDCPSLGHSDRFRTILSDVSTPFTGELFWTKTKAYQRNFANGLVPREKIPKVFCEINVNEASIVKGVEVYPVEHCYAFTASDKE